MTEKEIIKKMQSMCEASLSPYNFEKWEDVKRCLESARHKLANSDVDKQRELLIKYAKIENGGDKIYETDIRTIERLLKDNN
jgi:phage-related protein